METQTLVIAETLGYTFHIVDGVMLYEGHAHKVVFVNNTDFHKLEAMIKITSNPTFAINEDGKLALWSTVDTMLKECMIEIDDYLDEPKVGLTPVVLRNPNIRSPLNERIDRKLMNPVITCTEAPISNGHDAIIVTTEEGDEMIVTPFNERNLIKGVIDPYEQDFDVFFVDARAYRGITLQYDTLAIRLGSTPFAAYDYDFSSVYTEFNAGKTELIMGDKTFPISLEPRLNYYPVLFGKPEYDFAGPFSIRKPRYSRIIKLEVVPV